jgi:ribosomal protein S18 acetylase RimI-like enzyme
MTATRDEQVILALSGLCIPEGVTIRAWDEDDFTAIQRLSAREGWMTPCERPRESFASWQHSWPALVAVSGAELVGFIRAITDGSVSTYVCELLVAADWRGRGIGIGLLAVCHHLYPTTRLDLLAGEESQHFYKRLGCRESYGFRITRLE